MVAWNRIDTVLLDMDGTLLDLHFDNHFWLTHVPQQYAMLHRLTFDVAYDELVSRYRRVEGTLDWYCVDYWTRELGLDIRSLKQDLEHLIQLRPHTLEFLTAAKAKHKRLVLVTNAHNKALALKLARTAVDKYLDGVVCSHDLGLPKEHVDFWERLQAVQPFERSATLLVDDSLPVLRAAKHYGIGHLVAVKHPDSKRPRRDIAEFPAIDYLNEIMP